MNYDQYMKSNEWKARRQIVLEFWGHKCAICGTAESVQVHHRTYKRLGNEMLTDLIPLCLDCHKLFTERFQTRTERVERVGEAAGRVFVNAIVMAGKNA